MKIKFLSPKRIRESCNYNIIKGSRYGNTKRLRLVVFAYLDKELKHGVKTEITEIGDSEIVVDAIKRVYGYKEVMILGCKSIEREVTK